MADSFLIVQGRNQCTCKGERRKNKLVAAYKEYKQITPICVYKNGKLINIY